MTLNADARGSLVAHTRARTVSLNAPADMTFGSSGSDAYGGGMLLQSASPQLAHGGRVRAASIGNATASPFDLLHNNGDTMSSDEHLPPICERDEGLAPYLFPNFGSNIISTFYSFCI
jgi:hypothetical protein